MRRLVPVILVSLLGLSLIAADCNGNDTGSPTPSSGIEGMVTIGPACPVERIDTPCPDKPYQATIVVEDGQGDEVARVESGEDGRFSVALSPGTYALVPQWPNEGGPPSAAEQQVVVREGEYAHVDIQYDSGIR